MSLFCDENTRKYLLKMKDDENTEKLAELLAPGVSWPGYRNEEKNRDVIVHGYSMEKPVMEITISGIGWWTPETVVRSVVDKWGEVKECARSTYTHHGHTMETDKWRVKLVKKKEIIIPPVVIHAGSERSSEERELWKVFYKGVVKVCYRCLKKGHLGRDCTEDPINMEYLASQSMFEEAPSVPKDDEVAAGEQKTFAQIVKADSYVATRLALQKAAELREKEMEEKAAKVSQIRERGRQKKGESLGTPGGDGELRGFSIDRINNIRDWSSDVDSEVDKTKRPAASPASAPPEKAARMTPKGDRSQTPSEPRRAPGLH